MPATLDTRPSVDPRLGGPTVGAGCRGRGHTARVFNDDSDASQTLRAVTERRPRRAGRIVVRADVDETAAYAGSSIPSSGRPTTGVVAQTLILPDFTHSSESPMIGVGDTINVKVADSTKVYGRTAIQ